MWTKLVPKEGSLTSDLVCKYVGNYTFWSIKSTSWYFDSYKLIAVCDFFLKVYLLHERNPQKKRVWNLPLFDFLPFTNNGGDHFANVGRVVQESIQHFFLWDFLCKQMNIYVELRIIWDKAKFIRGKGRSDEIWKTKMGTNDLISESYWNILEQNMFCKCQRSGIRTRSGGKIKIEDLETQN